MINFLLLLLHRSEAYTLDSRSCNSIAVALKNFTALESLKIEIPFLDEEEF